MKLLTNKKLQDIGIRAYNEGFNNGYHMNAVTTNMYLDDILDQVHRLEKNTWDRDRIKAIKDIINEIKERLRKRG